MNELTLKQIFHKLEIIEMKLDAVLKADNSNNTDTIVSNEIFEVVSTTKPLEVVKTQPQSLTQQISRHGDLVGFKSK